MKHACHTGYMDYIFSDPLDGSMEKVDQLKMLVFIYTLSTPLAQGHQGSLKESSGAIIWRSLI